MHQSWLNQQSKKKPKNDAKGAQIQFPSRKIRPLKMKNPYKYKLHRKPESANNNNFTKLIHLYKKFNYPTGQIPLEQLKLLQREFLQSQELQGAFAPPTPDDSHYVDEELEIQNKIS